MATGSSTDESIHLKKGNQEVEPPKKQKKRRIGN